MTNTKRIALVGALLRAHAKGLREAADMLDQAPLLDDPPGHAKNRYQYASKTLKHHIAALRVRASKIEKGEA